MVNCQHGKNIIKIYQLSIHLLGIIRMKRESIEKAGVAGSMWRIQGTGMRGRKAENLEKTARRKIQTARVQNRTTRQARRFYALLADWYTNSIVGRGDFPASIRRRAR